MAATIPLDASQGEGPNSPLVSDFLTIQSFSNFSVMTGAIFAAWNALIRLCPDWFSTLLVPYLFACAWAVVSLWISPDALKKNGKWDRGALAGGVFVAFINALILASAVVGISQQTTSN